jgi:hypothetical protein
MIDKNQSGYPLPRKMPATVRSAKWAWGTLSLRDDRNTQLIRSDLGNLKTDQPLHIRISAEIMKNEN